MPWIQISTRRCSTYDLIQTYRALLILLMAGLETTCSHQGTCVEHRPIIEACGKVSRATLESEAHTFRDGGPLELTRRQTFLVWAGELESTHEPFKPEMGTITGAKAAIHRPTLLSTPRPSSLPQQASASRDQGYKGSPRGSPYGKSFTHTVFLLLRIKSTPC